VKASPALPLLSLPLVVVGALLGHAAGYSIAPSPQDHTLHGYLGYAPFLAVVCLGLVGVAIAQRIRGRLAGSPAAWPFAVLPPLAFTLQELVERLAAGLPAGQLVEPAVVLGLLVQLPLAVIAFRIARLLLRCADAVSEILSAQRRPAAPAVLVPVRPLEPALPPMTQASHTGFGRAPPGRAPSQ
jgi:hypothetical protein